MSVCEHSGRLNAYHDGELPLEERRALEEHIGRCPSCAREFEQLRSLSRLFAAVEMPEMSSDALGRLHRNVGSIRERLVVRMAGVLTAAAAAVLLICGVWLWRSWAAQELYEDPVWEVAAVTLQLDVSPSGNGEMPLAQWIVDDLSRENGHD